jgi:DNA repair exonuclease SbcCD ATPase subunit|tara:strand:+ start:1760 stop:3505 length:1746 start_codon:yes stop_codon:yes gene_type:complete
MIIFEKIRWKNFLSTGNVFNEIDIEAGRTNLIVGSNGSGKSTILDALTFSLFGKPFRKINKSMLVNSINEKDTIVEIEFRIGKQQYKVVRGIKPNKLEIYANGKLWNQESSLAEQQKNFEASVLKMNYKSFTQIVVLGSSTFVPFMRLPTTQRRDIIEDILDIQVFSTMNVLLKDKNRENLDEIRDIEYQLDLIRDKIEIQKQHMLTLEKRTQEEIDRKEEKIFAYKKTELQGAEDVALLTEQIGNLNKEMQDYQSSNEKLKKLNTFLIKVTHKLNTCKKEHEFFENNHVCPTCTQELSEEFRSEKLEAGQSKVDEMTMGYEDLNNAILEEENRFSKFTELSTEVNNINTTISQTNFQLMTIRKQVETLQDEIKELQGDNVDKKAEFDKLQTLVNEKKDLGKQHAILKKDRDVLTTASQLLKDNGIKSRIIKTYLPTMNKLINDFLQRMEFYVNFTLDENFEEIIKSRYRDVFSYESFSEGEKARIDISLLLTWRSIAKLKNSVDTNLLILDEIFDGSLDQSGTSDLGWILRNFDDSTKVFVISHKQGLDDKFDRTITVDKTKNFSVLTETVNEVTHGLVG